MWLFALHFTYDSTCTLGSCFVIICMCPSLPRVMIVHVLVTFYNDIHMQITNIIWPPGSLPPAVPLVKQKKFVWPYIVSMKQLRRVAKGYEILIFDLTKLRTEFEQLYYEQ